MVSTRRQPSKPSVVQTLERVMLPFFASHGAPIIFSVLLLYVLWWGHTPTLADNCEGGLR